MVGVAPRGVGLFALRSALSRQSLFSTVVRGPDMRTTRSLHCAHHVSLRGGIGRLWPEVLKQPDQHLREFRPGREVAVVPEMLPGDPERCLATAGAPPDYAWSGPRTPVAPRFGQPALNAA